MPDSVDSPAPLSTVTLPSRSNPASSPNESGSPSGPPFPRSPVSASSACVTLPCCHGPPAARSHRLARRPARPASGPRTRRVHYLRVCTVVVSLEPGERVPLRLLGIRDELTSRPWRPPARHWPGSPLIGGIDEQAGGTWLAVHPGVPRVACLLNGRGQPADPARRRSRGDLSLRAAAEGPGFLRDLAANPDALAAYDPFHLICATVDSVTALTWEGGPPSGARSP